MKLPKTKAAITAGILFATGACGTQEEAPGAQPPGEVSGQQAEALRPPPITYQCTGNDPALCNLEDLTKFWVVDHFIANHDKPVQVDRDLRRDLLAKAQPDECFSGIGQPITQPPCMAPAQPKVNDAYVWGLTLAEGRHDRKSLWFGTVANTQCLVEASFLGVTTPQQNPLWVCEFNQSASGTGDFRPPNLFQYDLKTETLEPKNPSPGPADELRKATLGFRSAGNLVGVVFLAGPAVPQLGGINIFAFDADTGELLGAQNFQQYGDIRSWLTANGELYAGVSARPVPTNSTDPGGYVLKWTGEKSRNPAKLFKFEIVGNLDTEASNLAEYKGRIFVTTWPVVLSTSNMEGPSVRVMGLYRGPVLPQHHGLTSANKDQWKEIWKITDYDPDPVAAAVTGGGALAQHDGKLFWGTMHVPFLATGTAIQLNNAGIINLDTNGNGTLDPEELATTALGTHRAFSTFRGDELDSKYPDIRLMYGEAWLPKYDPTQKSYTIAFDDAHQNKLAHPMPVWGSSGMGNFFNAYDWSMTVYDDALYIGTFDWSILVRGFLEGLTGPAPMNTLPFDLTNTTMSTTMNKLLSAMIPQEGADLFRIREAEGRARAESLTGVGNPINYGVRTMVADEHHLFLGTANPMNLDPAGGWELLKMKEKEER